MSIPRHEEPLMAVIQGHKHILENAAFLKSVPRQITKEAMWSKLVGLEGFLKEGLPGHFRFEEETAFPLVLSRCPQDRKARLSAVIDELKREHVALNERIDKVRGILEDNIFPLPAPVMAELNMALTSMVDMLLAHASREDDEVFAQFS